MIIRKYDIEVLENVNKYNGSPAKWVWKHWHEHDTLDSAKKSKAGLIKSGFDARIRETSTLKIYRLIED